MWCEFEQIAERRGLLFSERNDGVGSAHRRVLGGLASVRFGRAARALLDGGDGVSGEDVRHTELFRKPHARLCRRPIVAVDESVVRAVRVYGSKQSVGEVGGVFLADVREA